MNITPKEGITDARQAGHEGQEHARQRQEIIID